MNWVEGANHVTIDTVVYVGTRDDGEEMDVMVFFLL